MFARCFGGGFFRAARRGCFLTAALAAAVLRVVRPGVIWFTTCVLVSSTAARAGFTRRVRRGGGASSTSVLSSGIGDGAASAMAGVSTGRRACAALSLRESEDRPAERVVGRVLAPAGEFDLGVNTTRCGGLAGAGEAGVIVTTVVGRCCRRVVEPRLLGGGSRLREADPGVATEVDAASNSVNELATEGDASGSSSFGFQDGRTGLGCTSGTSVTTLVGRCCRLDTDPIAGLAVPTVTLSPRETTAAPRAGVLVLGSIAMRTTRVGCCCRRDPDPSLDEGSRLFPVDGGAATGVTAASTIGSSSSFSAVASLAAGALLAAFAATSALSPLFPGSTVSTLALAAALRGAPAVSTCESCDGSLVLTILRRPTRGGVFSSWFSCRPLGTTSGAGSSSIAVESASPVDVAAAVGSTRSAAAALGTSVFIAPSSLSGGWLGSRVSGSSSSAMGMTVCINEALIVTSPDESRSTGALVSESLVESSANESLCGAPGSGVGTSSASCDVSAPHWIPFFFFFPLFPLVPDLRIELGTAVDATGGGGNTTSGVSGDSGEARAVNWSRPSTTSSRTTSIGTADMSRSDAARGVGKTMVAVLACRRREGVTGGPRNWADGSAPAAPPSPLPSRASCIDVSLK